jgi:hypothetical protein
MGEAKRRRASETPVESIFPGEHGPVQPEIADLLRKVVDALQKGFPGHGITLFLNEKEPSAGRTLPRFNYVSTEDRADMIAVLKAFIAKTEDAWAKVEKIADDPPTEVRQ